MKRILFVMLAATLCMSLLTGCFFIPDTPENSKEMTGNGHREYDSNHPDDSERNPFFCITSAAFDRVSIAATSSTNSQEPGWKET